MQLKRSKTLPLTALCLLCSHSLFAQDLVGDWQGTLNAGPQKLRSIVHIEKSEAAGLKASVVNIDQTLDRGVGTEADAVVVQGNKVKITIAAIPGSYEGTLAADSNSISGTWTQGGGSLPLTLTRATPATAWKDPSPHTVTFVPVEQDVQLEVLDWGGKGQTLLLVPGAGRSAHVYDAFAAKLIARYHVIGVTRRGFGASSVPSSGYGADRLGDDVLAVMDKLQLAKPVLVGHSLGGQELSSIGSRYPEKVAGLVYLDAAYSYAFYAPGVEPYGMPTTPLSGIAGMLQAGQQQYTHMPVPILAIYALPHAPAPRDPTEEKKAEAVAKAFEQGVSSARVVRIANANHFVYASNPAEVLREMESFLNGLKQVK